MSAEMDYGGSGGGGGGGNGKLRQWLIEQVDCGKYPGLVWENEEKSIFRIPWKHAGKQDYNRDEDAALFKVTHARPLTPRRERSSRGGRGPFGCAADARRIGAAASRCAVLRSSCASVKKSSRLYRKFATLRAFTKHVHASPDFNTLKKLDTLLRRCYKNVISCKKPVLNKVTIKINKQTRILTS